MWAMGVSTESAICNQLRKAQGETNDRLDALLAEQRRTNELLARVVHTLSATAHSAS